MIGKQIAFALQVPPAKLAARIALSGKRKALQWRASRGWLRRTGLEQPAEPMADTLPLGLFAPHAQAERLADGSFAFTFLNRRETFALPIDWHRADLHAGTKLWLLNLHYMEYLHALADADFELLVRDWIAGNPPYAPTYWTYNWNSYSLSIRAVMLMRELARRRLGNDLVALIARSVFNQLRFLERNIESDVGGNHLVKNIKALLWGAAFFTGPAAQRWRRLGLRLLKRELPRQMLPDGMHYELSPSYHCQVYADLLEVRALIGEDPLAGAFDAALARAAQVAADLAHPDGFSAQFGDAGLHMAHSPADCLAAHRALFGSAPAPRAGFAFRNAGYYGARDETSLFVADAGRIAPPSLPAHGHSDMLSFEWSVGGERIIVDQGVLEYSSGAARDLSRTAAAHNTISIDGMDQAEFFGAFRCGRQGRMRVIEHRETDQGLVLEAEHDGYRRLHGGPIHRRRFGAETPRRIRVEDQLEPPAQQPARSTLLLHPEVEVEPVEPNRVRLRRGAVTADVTGSHKLAIEPARWWPDMGFEQPTHRLVMTLPPGTGEAWLELAA